MPKSENQTLRVDMQVAADQIRSDVEIRSIRFWLTAKLESLVRLSDIAKASSGYLMEARMFQQRPLKPISTLQQL